VIAIAVLTIVSQEIFDAAQQVRHATPGSAHVAEPGKWLLRNLVRCGPCGVLTGCVKTVSGRPRGARHAQHYYVCPHRDPLRAGGDELRCREHGIRADELDPFVFAQLLEALLRPEVLLAGESALASRTPAPDDELLAAQLGGLNRRLEAAEAEPRRLVDVYLRPVSFSWRSWRLGRTQWMSAASAWLRNATSRQPSGRIWCRISASSARQQLR